MLRRNGPVVKSVESVQRQPQESELQDAVGLHSFYGRSQWGSLNQSTDIFNDRPIGLGRPLTY